MTAIGTGWTPRERGLLVLCFLSLAISVAGYLDLGGSAGADPVTGHVGRIDSHDIRNNSIRSKDILDGTLRASDIGIYTQFQGSVTVPAGGGFNQFPASVSCDPGHRAISGGYTIVSTNPGSIEIDMSRPDNPLSERWIMEARRTGQFGGTVFPFAVCFRN